ncbi:accessory gene regulator ArgB-like protein [Caldalkalibacillus mannanilyticus]|uniref:accessory gene regulator ArgB-like protein n=1 Tax=Caldalkalibacillus mannanilyticus TaxID=1418 RepID=UPI000467FF6D|nr:accessory gene regulator B family protein [Caldalkalibacillus mannanilyticus]
MISNLAEKIAVYIKEQSDHEASIAVLKNALEKIINAVSIVFLGIMSGALFGQLTEVLIVLMAFATLRFFSGGYHFKSGIICVIASVGVANVIPFSGMYMEGDIVCIITIFNLLLVAMYAPSRIEDTSNVSEKHYPIFKIISILIVSFNFVTHSALIAVTFFIQAISLIERTRG